MIPANLSSQTELLLTSYQKWTGKTLLHYSTQEEAATKLYHAPFVIVSHGIETDPIFNYANLAAQQLWELDWDGFTKLPSRLSAEAMLQNEREAFMAQVTKFGYVDHYTGIRISKTGKRFYIIDTTVWNIVDELGIYKGQAATFGNWKFIE